MMRKLFFIVFFMEMFFSSSLVYADEISNKGRISGYVFGDYFYNLSRDTSIRLLQNVANNGIKDLNGLQIRRLYFTYDYTISSKFSTRLRLAYEPNSFSSDGKISVFLKDSYLKWSNLFFNSDLLIGIQPTPTWEISEEIWGNRFLEQTIMDLRKYGSSRDLGISLQGKFDSEGIFKYCFMVGSGTGNKIETDKFKKFYFLVEIAPMKPLIATLYFDINTRQNILDTLISNKLLKNNELLYSLFLGYRVKEKYTFGLEGFISHKQNATIRDGAYEDKDGLGISFFAIYYLSKQVSLVGRFDYFDPNTDSAFKGDSRNWFILSLNYKPDPKVTISPNVIIETYESVPNGRTIDASVTPRITFFYSF